MWGCASSAYQIEGAPLHDGAGPSIWQRFVHTPGHVYGGATGDVACDHYHRVKQYCALMRAIGIKAYRFSTSWSRILPQGRGAPNQAGLDFYERLIEQLLEYDIALLLTLYHWDLPQALGDRGGWLNADCANWFADYAHRMFCKFDGWVQSWITLNEPWVIVDGGHVHGTLALGHCNVLEAPVAAHHLLCAHGRAVQVYRADGKHQIGIAVNLEPTYPASSAPDDLAACILADAYMNRQYLEPIFLKRDPSQMQQIYGSVWRDWPQSDADLIGQPLDFLGINYYTRSVCRHATRSQSGAGLDAWSMPVASVRQRHARHTAMGWEIYPQGLLDTLLDVTQRYGPLPLYVMENGAAFDEPADARGLAVHDAQRIAYLASYIAALRTALECGVDVRGYMVWSLLDNFEWAHGYSKRFGLVHVNFDTLQRTPKDSAWFYAKLIGRNGGYFNV